MYGRSFDRKKRKTPRNTQTPHKLKRTSPKKGNGPEKPPISQSKAVTRSQRERGKSSLPTLGSIIPNGKNKEKERGDNVGTGKTRHRRMDNFDLRTGARRSPVATLAGRDSATLRRTRDSAAISKQPRMKRRLRLLFFEPKTPSPVDLWTASRA